MATGTLSEQRESKQQAKIKDTADEGQKRPSLTLSNLKSVRGGKTSADSMARSASTVLRSNTTDPLLYSISSFMASTVLSNLANEEDDERLNDTVDRATKELLSEDETGWTSTLKTTSQS
jgi:hypothetical protein